MDDLRMRQISSPFLSVSSLRAVPVEVDIEGMEKTAKEPPIKIKPDVKQGYK